MSDTPDLKPCPFCGGEVELLSNIVSCMHCLCALPDGYGYGGENIGFQTEGEAIAAWNTRAVDPAAIREAALREAAKLCDRYDYLNAQGIKPIILELIGEKK